MHFALFRTFGVGLKAARESGIATSSGIERGEAVLVSDTDDFGARSDMVERGEDASIRRPTRVYAGGFRHSRSPKRVLSLCFFGVEGIWTQLKQKNMFRPGSGVLGPRSRETPPPLLQGRGAAEIKKITLNSPRELW